ncbi:GNAT family N-acetyltransferase [Shewanella sp. 0m-8]
MSKGYSVVAEDWQDSSGRIQCFINGDRSELGYLNWAVREGSVRSVEIVDVLVHDDGIRRKGIGSLLVEKLKEIMLKKGVFEIWGNTQFDDYPVHDFYRKHGFIFDTKVEDGGIDFRLEL